MKAITDRNWTALRKRLLDTWVELDERTLDRTKHDYGHLVELIETATGESRNAVRRKLDELIEHSRFTPPEVS